MSIKPSNKAKNGVVQDPTLGETGFKAVLAKVGLLAMFTTVLRFVEKAIGKEKAEAELKQDVNAALKRSVKTGGRNFT